MTTNQERIEATRYQSLGLIANPFLLTRPDRNIEVGVSLEIQAAANRLLIAISAAADADRAKPIVVTKTNEIPTAYPSSAVAEVEAALINDDSLNVVHAYIQLYMMRKGRVRSTLGIAGERVAFRSFDKTLARYISQIIDEPDEQLASFQLAGPDALEVFAKRFHEDPLGVTVEYFGTPRIEKRPDLARVADIRLASLEADTEESDGSVEIDSTVGEAPGTGVGLTAEDDADEHEQQIIVDYLIEYTSAHLSTVVARGLRLYRERGLAAMAAEWKVTKAPRKTLGAVAHLATARFRKLAIIYDGFENWEQIPEDLRRTIVVTLSDMRWMLDRDAVFVLLLEEGGVPELEEQFSAGTHLRWDFPWLAKLQQQPDVLEEAVAESWLSAASLPNGNLTMNDSGLSMLVEKANGSLEKFVTMASAAIEDAAQRGAVTVDGMAVAAGVCAADQEQTSHD